MNALLSVLVALATAGASLVAPLTASTQDAAPEQLAPRAEAERPQQPAAQPAPVVHASLTADLYGRPIENVFASGEGLYPGLIVRSPNREWLLTLQLDGNLVVYAADLTPRWQTGTSVRPRNAAMGPLGEFALYAHDGTKAWAVETRCAGARLILEDSGRLAIVGCGGILWTSDEPEAVAPTPP